MNLQLWHIIFTGIVLLFLGGLIGRWIAVLWSVAQASRMAGKGISTLLEEAADAIIADPPEEWAMESLHLLKAIDIRTDAPEFQGVLEQINAEIRIRLETGDWPGSQVRADREQGASE